MTHLAATEQLDRPQNIDFLSEEMSAQTSFPACLGHLLLHDGVNPGSAEVGLLSGF